MIRKTIIFIGIASILTVGVNLDNEQTKKRRQSSIDNTIKPPNYETYQKVKGYDYQSQTWKNYSDEEIRILREKQSYKSDGSYIYTPGRHVPSQQEIIEDYIEDNIDEILDKYGN